ncbi:MAG: hypothetical protein IKM94_05220 [Alphaproteobacteria bacterium]|nr:hypothetical protein [Alphaproteobacteria bacterium]
MRNYIRNIIISLTACFIPLFANADFLSKSGACWTDTEGCDEFWYCGEQSTGCAGNSPWGCDTKYWLYHGDSFTKHSRKFWCCDGTRSKSGLFKEGANWIVKTEVATETFANGKCTWTRKTNICGQVDNPEDKCTQPTPCPNGTVWHANQCVSPCSEGSAFASSSSYNCEPCEPGFRQGEKKWHLHKMYFESIF